MVQRLYSYLLTTLTGIVVVTKDKKKFPKPPYIICPNHSSYLDIVTMFQVIPHYFIFMGKNEIGNWPLFKIFFTRGMHILVDRKNPIKAHRAFEVASDKISEGKAVVIFPEGTIWPFVPKLKPFKNGAFKMAIEKNVPIVPVTFTRNFKLLHTGAFFKAKGAPGLCKAIVHDPIYTDTLKEEDLIPLKKQVYDTIESPFVDGNK